MRSKSARLNNLKNELHNLTFLFWTGSWSGKGAHDEMLVLLSDLDSGSTFRISFTRYVSEYDPPLFFKTVTRRHVVSNERLLQVARLRIPQCC